MSEMYTDQRSCDDIEQTTTIPVYKAPTLIPLGSLRSQTQATFAGVGIDNGIYS